MRVLKVALAVMFLATSFTMIGGVSSSDVAEAKGKKASKAGKCGVTNYYDKKSKSCKSKA